jgi:hypothetical protein
MDRERRGELRDEGDGDVLTSLQTVDVKKRVPAYARTTAFFGRSYGRRVPASLAGRSRFSLIALP